MNQLISRDDFFSYEFFPEEAFHKSQITNMITGLYMDFAEYYSDNHVISVGDLSSSSATTLFKLGVFARVTKLGEEYDSPFYDYTGLIHDLYEAADGDLIKMLDHTTDMMFSIDPETNKNYQNDIQTALEMRNMFYLNLEIPYGSLPYIVAGDKHPFSKEMKKKIFRNTPFLEVW